MKLLMKGERELGTDSNQRTHSETRACMHARADCNYAGRQVQTHARTDTFVDPLKQAQTRYSTTETRGTTEVGTEL